MSGLDVADWFMVLWVAAMSAHYWMSMRKLDRLERKRLEKAQPPPPDPVLAQIDEMMRGIRFNGKVVGEGFFSSRSCRVKYDDGRHVYVLVSTKPISVDDIQ